MAHATLARPTPSISTALFSGRIPSQPQVSLCCHVSPESSWGAGDALECNQPAVVHHVATEMDYCARHWKEVGRG